MIEVFKERLQEIVKAYEIRHSSGTSIHRFKNSVLLIGGELSLAQRARKKGDSEKEKEHTARARELIAALAIGLSKRRG